MSFAAIATFVLAFVTFALAIATCYMALLSRKSIANAEEIEQRRLKPYCTVRTCNEDFIEDGEALDYRQRFLGLPDGYRHDEKKQISLIVENSGPGVAINLLLSFVSRDGFIQGETVRVKEILGAGEKTTVPVQLHEHKYPRIDNGKGKQRLDLRELIDHSHYIILEYSDVMGHKFHSKKPLVTAEFDKQDKEARMGIPSSPVANETQFIDKKFEGLPWYKREVYVPDQVKLLATQSVGACEPGD